MNLRRPEDQLYLSPELEPLETDDILEMLLKHGKLKNVGEGANGVVFKMDLSVLDDREKNAIQGTIPDLNIDDDPQKAIKLLKIYSGEKAQIEMDNQNTAREIIEAPDSPLNGMVRVPRADKVKKSKLSDPEVIDGLTSLYHISLSPKNPKANFIIMDFIEGKTLEEIESRHILMSNREKLQEIFPSSDPDELINSLRGEELRRVIHMIIGQAGRENEFLDYCNMLGDKLRGSQIFDKKVYQYVKEAIEMLHKHGFYHRDLHLGNIMIGDDGIIYIIDFDQAKTVSLDDQDEIDNVYNVELNTKKGYRKRKLTDNWIIKHLEQVTQNKDDARQSRKQELETKLLSNIISRADILWNRFIKTQKDISDKNVENLANAFASKFATPGLGNEYSEYLISGLIALSKAGRVEECKAYALEKLQKEKISERETNLLNYFIEYIS